VSDFETAREELRKAREALAGERAAVYSAQQRGARLAAQLARAGRVPSRAETARLNQELEQAKSVEARHREATLALAAAVAERLRAFAAIANPRDAIAQWSGDTPILLLPVRLETRFRQLEAIEGRVGEELWVRLYPDDCSVDSFEPALSEDEVASARRFWIAVWAAGGIASERRTAWRDLVVARGPGRAAWIIKQYAPQGPEPVKADAGDVLLVIAVTEPPSAAQQAALATYWESVWRADGASDATEQAGAALAQTLNLSAADAAALSARFKPANFAARPMPPTSKADVAVDVVWLSMPVPTGLKSTSWTTPAHVNVLPDRFVILGYQGDQLVFEAEGAPIPTPLVAGPDPSAPPGDELRHDANGNLVVPEDMRWMTDFDRAVEVGMGIRIPLDPARVDPSRPISRVIALGLKLSDDAEGGRARLERLLTGHRYGYAGLAIVPQGTPTNNTQGDAAGYRRDADADAAYDALFAPEKPITSTAEWHERQDGQWLADALGVDLELFQDVPHAGARDLAEARAMNRVLWPATLGYAIETMLHPVFGGGGAVDATRWFYSHFVAGRGFLPCVRIGEQPYGILPASALSQWKPGSDSAPTVGGLTAPEGFGTYLQRLLGVLAIMRGDWSNLAQAMSSVNKPGDAHQILLDIIGLHPASVEFHQRYAESFAYLFNRMKFDGLGAQLLDFVNTRGPQEQGMQLLRRLGYQGAVTPDALQRFFFTRSQRLNGTIIDERPLSERDPVRSYASGDRNYLEWLADATRQSLEDLRLERGFGDNGAPDTLLYTMLRHALLLGYWDSALRLHVEKDVLDSAAVFSARREPAAIHIAPERAAGSESRYAYLYSRDVRVSGDASVTVGARIPALIGQSHAADHLADQLSALDLIKSIPTARLERCFAEHIDTASYRLDSWLMGLVHMKLASTRYVEARDPTGAPRGDVETRRGVYLGAYGWLENLRRRAPLENAALRGDLAAVFEPDGENPLLRDPTNGGFVMAPSISQAATAAILRAGYLANASSQAPDALAVDLSSGRVRLALGLIEGIRNGQPLGALLGYRFQRGLHEDHQPLELDSFIHAMRPHFPLVANNIVSTMDTSASIETIEANNVIDGLKLIERVRKPENRLYPFGLPLPVASPAETAAINAEVDRLLEMQDSLADVALAEGVHQSVLGNYDRVSAALDAYAKGTFPPEPEFIRTPRGGVTLTHRVGLHFDAAAVAPVPVANSPRAHALASVNQWLSSLLPDPAEVGCRVEWLDPVTGTAEEEIVTQRDLALQPIDLLYVATLDGAAAMGELEDRIVRHVWNKRSPRGDAALSVSHTVRLSPPLKTFFELAPVLRHLRAVLLGARPLAPTDITPPGEAERAQDALQSIPRARAALLWDEMDALAGALAGFDAGALTIDAAIDQAVALFERASRFGLQQVGWGFVYALRQRVFATLISQVQEVVGRWRTRLSDFDTGAASYAADAAGMSVEQRFEALSRLDLSVAALPVSPRPPTPHDYETALHGPANPQARRRLFANKLEALEAVSQSSASGLAALLAAFQAQLPLDAFDLTAVSVDETAQEISACKSDLQARIGKLKDEIDKRLAIARSSLTAHDQANSSAVRVATLQTAGSALLGDDVKLIPEFTLPPPQAAEFVKAYTQGASGALTQYLRTAKQVAFPVDDWLHGVARVRDKLYAWEQAALFAPILGGTEPELTPIQLPFRAGDGWLALEFDPRQSLGGERLLYTAHFAVPPAAGAMCGLLIDEWTEVLPTQDETVGLSFHYDRPGSEPPQAWLLATPPRANEAWRWGDLIGAVTETFELAKLRAVEPTQIDSTPYAAFLPATASASSLRGIAITANFARVNDINAFVQGDADG
jgi:hypothetical protein